MDPRGGHPFDVILTGRPPAIQAAALRLRSLIGDIHPRAIEVIWGRERSAGYGFGPSKASQHYAYLRPFANHVTFGFPHGVDLDDPTGRLEGRGKRMRHIKVRSLKEADDPELRALLVQAVAERRAALSADSESPG